MPEAPRLLLITLSNIGDLIMTTPVMEVLHYRYPQARLDVVADARSSELLRHCPYLGELLHKDKKAGWRGVLALLRRLRRTRYELSVDLRSDGLSYLLRARRRLHKWSGQPLGAHAVQQHLGVVAALLDGEPPLPRIWLSAAERAFAAAALPAGGRWLALAPGANWPPKRWPAARFAELARALADTVDGVVLLGSQADQADCRAIAAGLPLPAVNLSGQTGLLAAAAVLERCALFVGNDSGLGHLAAAVGIPTVTVFGPGQPLRYHPWGLRSRYLLAPDADLARLEAGPVADAARGLLAG
ncbi:MAG TPA: glycosyltransferase family 9 protein [Candidatus Competibacteraceae bacterium]|nr:glycosyltransferase family 9 protein [Candidatus Competibacteraceae bacterium]